MEAGHIAVGGHVEEAHLLKLGVLVLNVGDVYYPQASAVVCLIGEVAPVIKIDGSNL